MRTFARSSSHRWPHRWHTWILLVAALHAVTNPQFGQWCSFAISTPRYPRLYYRFPSRLDLIPRPSMPSIAVVNRRTALLVVLVATTITFGAILWSFVSYLRTASPLLLAAILGSLGATLLMEGVREGYVDRTRAAVGLPPRYGRIPQSKTIRGGRSKRATGPALRRTPACP